MKVPAFWNVNENCPPALTEPESNAFPFDVVVCAIDRSPGEENPLADVGLEVRSVLTKAELDAVSAG